MNNENRRAGRSTREMAARRRTSSRWMLAIVVAVAMLAAFLIFNSKILGIAGLGIIVVVVIARLVMDYGEVRDRMK